MVSAFLEMELFRPLFCFCVTVGGEAMWCARAFQSCELLDSLII